MNLNRRLAFILIGLVAGSALILAQTPALPLDITAMSVNVNGAGEQIDFHIVKFSTDADSARLSAAWQAGGAPAPAPGAAGPRGAGRGAAAAAPALPRTPEGALATTLKDLPHVGYFWTSEVAGYLIRYAQRIPLPGGGSRIILLTDHRLGFSKKNWQPTGSATPNDYDFTLIELRLPATGEGDGKASITGKITVDPAAKTFTLDSYEALPVVMKGVKVRVKT